MTIDEAIKILDPATTAAELAKLETYGKLIGTQAAIKATEDACLIAVEIMERSMWIPCSERLPDVKQRVLFWAASNETIFAGYYRYIGKNGTTWFWAGKSIYGAKYWMPLPEPPEEGREENGL